MCFRDKIISGIPMSIKLAASVGIGIFIAFIGLTEANIIVADPGVKVALGNIKSPAVLLAIAGLLFTALLVERKVKGALLWGIIATTVAGMFVTSSAGITVTRMPRVLSDIVKIPSIGVFKQTLFQMDILSAFKWSLLPVIFTFAFMDIFDTVGSISGLAAKLNIIDEKGSFPKADRVLVTDATGTVIGAVCGTTTVTTYIESAAGIAEGGKTGLTAVVVGFCFLLGLFFTPFAGLIPPVATAPALILVGLFMLEPILKIGFKDITEGLPAFLTIIMIPLTYNIAHGLVFGIVSYTVIKLISGRSKEVHPLLRYWKSINLVLSNK